MIERSSHNTIIYNRKALRIIIHLLVWTTIVGASLININKEERVVPDDYIRIFLPLIEVALIFYLNYFFFVNKFIFQNKRYILFVVTNILIIALFRFDNFFVDFFTGHEDKFIKEEMHNNEHHPSTFGLIKSLFGLIMPTVLALVFKISERSRAMELKKKDTENMQLKSELKSLKYQLHPHFFFNALNSIYALVDESPTKTQLAVHNLSKLMQHLLYDSENEAVDLFSEINFLKKYIQLMELRQTDDVTANYSFPDIRQNQYYIAPLLLIPILENAYKHGISANNASVIDFELSIKENKLSFISRNTNNPKSESDISGSGIGLENLKKRLELIYPQKYQLCYGVENDTFCLSLIIDFK